MTYNIHHWIKKRVFRHTQLLCRTIHSFTNSADKLLIKIPILLRHVLQVPMLIYSICTILIPINGDMFRKHEWIYSSACSMDFVIQLIKTMDIGLCARTRPFLFEYLTCRVINRAKFCEHLFSAAPYFLVQNSVVISEQCSSNRL